MIARDLAQLRDRRARLVEQAAEQRAAVGRLVLSCASPFRIAAVGTALVGAFRRRPVTMILAGVAIVVLRPSRVLRWTIRALPVVLTVRSWMRRVAGTRPPP